MRPRGRWLTLRCISWAVFLFWQGGSALLLWRFSAYLNVSAQDAAFFDLAGRQRLTAQQTAVYLDMVREGHPEDRARLREHAGLFEEGLRRLELDVRKHDAIVARSFLPGGGRAAAALAEFRSYWDSYRPRLEALSRTPRGDARFAAAYAAAAAGVPRLVAAGDDYVKAEVLEDAVESRRMKDFISLMAALNLLVSLVLLLAMHRWVLAPMEALQAAIGRFEDEDFSARASGPSYGEMSSLIGAFNAMAEAVERATGQLRDILDNSPAVVFLKDLESRYLFVNRRYETLFRRPHRSMKGKTDFDVFPGELAERLRADDREVLRRGEAMEVEEALPHDDGPRQYLSVKFPLRDPAGAPYGVCGIATDVTERKRVEEQLRQSQKMDSIGRLAGGVAHDFNNMLTSILGYCRLLRDRVPDDSALADLDEIRLTAERAAALTRQLLAFSRKQALRPELLDLNAVVGGMERMIRTLVGEAVVLRLSLSPGLGRVKADKSQVEQVVMNLAVNARDAMSGGGGLTVETFERELDERYCRLQQDARPGRYATLAVSDTGHGMDAETLRRIFEPFFTTKGLGQGTGLGLATVYGIVRQSGGHIDVRSEPGKGTSFEVYLPVATEDPRARRPASAPAPPGAGKTVLLVDDDASVRRLAARLLSQAGCTVLEAGDPESALSLFREKGPEIGLLVTEVALEQSDGRRLAGRLRELKAGLKVIYMSGYADEALARPGALDPGARFLPKPFTAEGLVSAVRQALDAAA